MYTNYVKLEKLIMSQAHFLNAFICMIYLDNNDNTVSFHVYPIVITYGSFLFGTELEIWV